MYRESAHDAQIPVGLWKNQQSFGAHEAQSATIDALEYRMAAQPIIDKVWIEDTQLVRDAVDDRTLQILLGDGLPRQLDRRGSATPLRFKATYDRGGRYAVDAMLLRSERGVVVVLHDDLYRPGDPFYLEMNGKIVKFTVVEVRRGSRPDDPDSTRVLHLTMAT